MCIPIWVIVLIVLLVIILVFILITNSVKNKTNELEFYADKLLTYVKDINSCVVFFTLIMSMFLFFSFYFLKEKALDDNIFNNIISFIFILVGASPAIALFSKLFFNLIKIKEWKKVVGTLILMILTGTTIVLLLAFSISKIFPDIMNILKNNGILN